jgi:hypothetical protein
MRYPYPLKHKYGYSYLYLNSNVVVKWIHLNSFLSIFLYPIPCVLDNIRYYPYSTILKCKLCL